MNHYKNFLEVFNDEINSLNHVISNLNKKNINDIINSIIEIIINVVQKQAIRL